MSINKCVFYSFGPVLSRNGVYNMVVDGRGSGKTFGSKKLVIRKFLRAGEQFIYMRRYKEELATAARTFFADIEREFPDYDFRANGKTAQSSPISRRPDKQRVWDDMGFFVPLSTAQSQKSVAFPKVTTIIFDEFIVEKGRRYLPDEVTAFNNFYNTVDRYQDKTRVLFLANSVSIMNPYFLEFDIQPDTAGEWVSRNDGFIVVHFPQSTAYADEVYKSRFGRFIQGTEYAEYAVGNEFADSHHTLISSKGTKARYVYTLRTTKGWFSVWFDITTGGYFVQEKRPKQEILYTNVAEYVSEDCSLLLKNDGKLEYPRRAFRSGRMLFDKPKTRNIFLETFK